MMHRATRHYSMGRAVSIAAVVSIRLGSVFATSAHAGRAAATPAPGGSYSYRLTDAPDCLDPQLTGSGSSDIIDSYIFDTLITIDNKGHYVGDLATSYK